MPDDACLSAPSSADSQYTLVLKSRALEDLERGQREMATERDELVDRVRALTTEREERTVTMRALKGERDRAAATLLAQHEEKDTLIATNRSLMERVAQLESQSSVLVEELASTRAEIVERAQRVSALEIERDAVVEKLQRMVHEPDMLSDARSLEHAARVETDEIRTEKMRIEEEFTAFQARVHAELAQNKTELMDMLFKQLSFYVKSHRMKLGVDTLSIGAILAEGFAVKNIIRFYRIVDRSLLQDEAVLHLMPSYFSNVHIWQDRLQLML